MTYLTTTIPARRPAITALTLSSAILFGLSMGACTGGEEDPHAHHEEGATEVEPLPEIADDARVFFVQPADGATVLGAVADGKVTVRVEMGAESLTVMPAGTLQEGAGHHHIIIDEDAVPRGTAVPADEHHIHYGGGQTSAELQLAPGPHVLRLQFADGAHRSYGSQLRASININVAAEGDSPSPASADDGDTEEEVDDAE